MQKNKTYYLYFKIFLISVSKSGLNYHKRTFDKTGVVIGNDVQILVLEFAIHHPHFSYLFLSSLH